MDGFEFVNEVRKRAAWRKIPIIVITAKAISHEEQARLNGFVERILQKDAYSGEDLLQEVRDLVVASIPGPASTEQRAGSSLSTAKR
jgi:CheY-like chemotaxis protein